MYKKLVENSNINKILENFQDGNKPSQFNLKFVMSTSLGNLTNATTIKSGNTFIIKINQNRAENKNTVLTIARTIIHEGIHARLREFAVREGSNETSFPGVYDYFRRFKKNWDHQQMATHYRESIADILQSFDNNQHSRQFYMDLSWEGLRYDGSTGNNAIYTWTSKSQPEKDRINKVISDYIKSNKNQNCQ